MRVLGNIITAILAIFLVTPFAVVILISEGIGGIPYLWGLR